MEENLAHVGSIVGNLKSMVIDMSNEIDTQSEQMERVQGKVGPHRHHGNHPSSHLGGSAFISAGHSQRVPHRPCQPEGDQPDETIETAPPPKLRPDQGAAQKLSGSTRWPGEELAPPGVLEKSCFQAFP